VLGGDGLPVAAVNVSAPSSRWTLTELRAKLSPVLLETVRAASERVVSGPLPARRRRATL
jgi:DNA-binding IclR family transcriptional regulator